MADALLPAPGFWAPYADLVGVPYAIKGRGPDQFDCYGLIAELERRHGRQVPDYESPATMPQVHAAVMSHALFWQPCELGPGAVVVLRCGAHYSHVGMVLPFDKVIHSWERSGGVCVEPLDTWRRRVIGAYTYKSDPA